MNSADSVRAVGLERSAGILTPAYRPQLMPVFILSCLRLEEQR